MPQRRTRTGLSFVIKTKEQRMKVEGGRFAGLAREKRFHWGLANFLMKDGVARPPRGEEADGRL